MRKRYSSGVCAFFTTRCVVHCRSGAERGVSVMAVCLLLLRLQVGTGGHQAPQQAALF